VTSPVHRRHEAPGASRAGMHTWDASLATGRAPHVRMNVDLVHRARTMLLALLPCALLGIVNTGHQTHLAMADQGLTRAADWRGAVLHLAGLDPDPSSLIACALHGLLYLLPLLAASAAAAVLSERVFARARHRELLPGVSVTVLLFVLSVPPTLPLWQAALGIAFGVIVGKEVFGGTGRNVFHPALTGLVFLYFAYPSSLRSDAVWTAVEGFRPMDGVHAAAAGGISALESAGATWWRSFVGHQPGALGDTSAIGCLLGAAFLLHRRLVSWRTLLAMVIGLVVAISVLPEAEALSFQGVPWYWHATLGSFAFGTVFFATDPVSGAGTNAGRWIHGGLVGALVAVIRVASPVHAEGTVLALLLGSVFAPLIDDIVVRVHIWRRQRRG